MRQIIKSTVLPQLSLATMGMGEVHLSDFEVKHYYDSG